MYHLFSETTTKYQGSAKTPVFHVNVSTVVIHWLFLPNNVRLEKKKLKKHSEAS